MTIVSGEKPCHQADQREAGFPASTAASPGIAFLNATIASWVDYGTRATYSMKLLGERYLQGRVEFASREPEGTTFGLAIPEKLPEEQQNARDEPVRS